MPENLIFPKKAARRVEQNMPMRISPLVPFALKMLIKRRPKRNTMTSADMISEVSPTIVPGCDSINPPCWKPMNEINNPIPTAMAFLRLGLIA